MKQEVRLMLLQRLVSFPLWPTLPIWCVLAILAADAALAASPLSRDSEPVVMTGAQLSTLAGIAPGRIAAFRYESGTGWYAIPVQVDERAVVDLGLVYDSSPVGLAPLVYTDAGTFTGADPNADFDSNDELVFMARDAGDRSLAPAAPTGTIESSSLELVITDPLASGEKGYVYLFEHDGSLDPSAGQSYVTYTFDLLSGSYLETYDLGNGTNPENSTVVAPYYSGHFADRWIQDQLSVTAGAATGVDILDRDKTGVLPGNCGRTEDTFAQGGGAFIANKSGPVRAIRSFMGANSGPYTQRDQFFYDRIEEGVLFHRVHEIGSGFNTTDYSPAASGTTYANNLNQGGVTIDGVPDTVTTGTITWELATGAQGSVVRSFTTETTIAGLVESSYYVDDTTPADDPCTGDDDALYGTSGPWWIGITCTDPVRPECVGTADDLRGFKRIYYAAPGLTVTDAMALDQEARTPLVVTVQGFVATPVPAAPTAPLALLLLAAGAAWLARSSARAGRGPGPKTSSLLPQ
jgi:hypothetical protein